MIDSQNTNLAAISSFGSETAVGLSEKLAAGKPLTVKLGFDPTSPDLHLGHYIVLRGAKKLQDLGHNVVIIIGDFTAAIGDPSGRNQLRPPLSEAQIEQNAKTYLEQLFMVLDKEKTQVQANSQWLKTLGMKDILALLSTQTLAQIMVREDFNKRFEAQTPIFMHELMYPLMQGLDSVAIKADVELGGTDQTFNLMMGRDLQKAKNQSQQAVMTFPLLVGLDGVQKMSKSLGNHIGLKDSPTDKFGKIMSVSDMTMWNYWSVLAEKTETEVNAMRQSTENPKNIKMRLAREVVALFHGEQVALQTEQEFHTRFSQKKIVEVDEVEIAIKDPTVALTWVMKELQFASSFSDAGRKIEQNGVRVNEEKVLDKHAMLNKGEDVLLQVGKLHVKKVKIR